MEFTNVSPKTLENLKARLSGVNQANLSTSLADGPPEQQAAIITGVNEDGTVALKIFYKTGLFDMASVPYSETYERGHWSAPPRV